MRWPRLTRRGSGATAPARSSFGYTPGTWAQAAVPDMPSMVMPPPEPGVTVIASGSVVEPPPAFMPPPLVGPPVPPVTPQAESAPVAAAAAPAFAYPDQPGGLPVEGPAVAYPDQPLATPPLPISMPVPDAAEPAAQHPVALPEVRLGFADGTNVPLDPTDPHTIALKAVADVLVNGESEGPPA